jgi:hypothetical protein
MRLGEVLGTRYAIAGDLQEGLMGVLLVVEVRE